MGGKRGTASCINQLVCRGGRFHSINFSSRNGKNCNHSHSREEILYHPSVYKTSMCETWNCSRYYCPFAHSMDELVVKQLAAQPSFGVAHIDPVAEDQRLRQLNLEDFWEDNDFEDVMCSSAGSDFSELASLQMRRVVHRTGSGGVPLITTTSLESSRIGGSCLQSLTSSLTNNGASNPDPGWITLTQGLRVELVVRGVSPLTGAELCLGTVRAPWETGAASVSGNQNRRGQQQASMVVKVIPILSETDPEAILALTNQLQTIARSEHKNIISVKKVHLVRFPVGTGSALAVAYERCSTSLYSTVAEGYRLRPGGSCFPRGLAGRMSSAGRQFTATSAAVGKISEFLSAVQRFHSLGMIHGRICPSNIFIDADANLKLGDFDSKLGLGRDNFLAESVVACWMDPELIPVLEREKEKINDWKRADVFATGLCVFLALTGQHPFGTFSDEDRTAAAGAAANFRPGPVASQFVEGTEKVLENMKNLSFVNQHLLYGTPLLLDLVMRMLVSRTEVSDLLSHPLFWDFYSIARFITRLDDASPVIKTVCETCPVPWTGCVTQEEWKLILGGGMKSPIDFKDTVLDLLRAIRQALGRHKASGCELCSCSAAAESADQTSCGNQHHLVSIFVTRMVSRFPAVVVRAWDASRIPSICGSANLEAFRRNHLSWMASRPRPVAQLDGSAEMLPSHAFVREYYVLVKTLLRAEDMMVSTKMLLGRDESPEILASILAMVEGARSSENNNNGVSVDPSILSSMLNSFGSMMRSDMLPPNVPKSFVVSLIEAAGGSPAVTPSPSSGVYYSTVTSLHLPSGATTAASSPVFAPVLAVASPRKGSPMSSSVGRHRRMSSCDGWEYAVACPPTMMDLGPRNGPHSLSALEGEEDESPPPGFQTVWQSMAEDGL